MTNKFKTKTESQVKKEILVALKKNFPKGVWYKIHGSLHQERGLPDILGCYNGKFFGIEIKAPGKEKNVTKYQIYQLNNILKAGGFSLVTSDPKYTIDCIKIFLKNF